ncbi:MAG TPA: hypothetical protein VII49_05280 [Rhizomicrobium sp.]
MSTEKDGILAALSLGSTAKLRNIKLCRGDQDMISPAELQEQSHSAIMQKRLCSIEGSSEAPRSKQPVVDVRALVSDM